MVTVSLPPFSEQLVVYFPLVTRGHLKNGQLNKAYCEGFGLAQQGLPPGLARMQKDGAGSLGQQCVGPGRFHRRILVAAVRQTLLAGTMW